MRNASGPGTASALCCRTEPGLNRGETPGGSGPGRRKRKISTGLWNSEKSSTAIRKTGISILLTAMTECEIYYPDEIDKLKEVIG